MLQSKSSPAALACERRPTGQELAQALQAISHGSRSKTGLATHETTRARLIEGNAQTPNIRFGPVALAKNDLFARFVEGGSKICFHCLPILPVLPA